MDLISQRTNLDYDSIIHSFIHSLIELRHPFIHSIISFHFDFQNWFFPHEKNSFSFWQLAHYFFFHKFIFSKFPFEQRSNSVEGRNYISLFLHFFTFDVTRKSMLYETRFGISPSGGFQKLLKNEKKGRKNNERLSLFLSFFLFFPLFIAFIPFILPHSIFPSFSLFKSIVKTKQKNYKNVFS